jgi:hypothetical protein
MLAPHLPQLPLLLLPPRTAAAVRLPLLPTDYRAPTTPQRNILAASGSPANWATPSQYYQLAFI